MEAYYPEESVPEESVPEGTVPGLGDLEYLVTTESEDEQSEHEQSEESEPEQSEQEFEESEPESEESEQESEESKPEPPSYYSVVDDKGYNEFVNFEVESELNRNPPSYYSVVGNEKEIVSEQESEQESDQEQSEPEYEPEQSEQEQSELNQDILEAIKKRDYVFMESIKGEININNIQYAWGNTPLHEAVIRNDKKMAKILIEKFGANVNVQNKSGLTPLYEAIMRDGNEEIIDLLLEKEADVNIKKYIGEHSPFNYAVIRKRFDIARKLLENGAEINEQNSDGNTLLSLFKKESRNEKVEKAEEFLEMNGANLYMKNKDGKSPLDLEKIRLESQLIECNLGENYLSYYPYYKKDGDRLQRGMMDIIENKYDFSKEELNCFKESGLPNYYIKALNIKKGEDVMSVIKDTSRGFIEKARLDLIVARIIKIILGNYKINKYVFNSSKGIFGGGKSNEEKIKTFLQDKTEIPIKYLNANLISLEMDRLKKNEFKCILKSLLNAVKKEIIVQLSDGTYKLYEKNREIMFIKL